MCELTINLPDESLAALAGSPEQAGARLRLLAAVKLFEMKELSSAAAAQLAGITRVEFLSRLHEFGVPTFDMTPEDFAQETRLA